MGCGGPGQNSVALETLLQQHPWTDLRRRLR
jgi:hypothetical protein